MHRIAIAVDAYIAGMGRKVYLEWSKVFLVLLPLIVGAVALFMSHGIYMTVDDVYMRMFIEGSAGDGSFGPSPFCLFRPRRRCTR